MVKMSDLTQGQSKFKEDRQFIEELDVVKKGYLHIKRPPTNIKLRLKTWQKRYIVLRDNTIDRGSRLEISSSKDSWEDKSKKCDQYVLDLRNSCSVCEYKKSKSFPFSFTLTRKGHASLILGAETEHELKQWMCAINLLSSKGPIRYHHNSTNSIFRDSINGNTSQKSDNSWIQDHRRSLHQCGGSLDLPGGYDCPYTLDKWIIQNKGSRKGSAPNHIEFSPKDGCLQLPRGFSVSVHRTPSGNKETMSGEMFLEVTSSYVILHQVDGEAWGELVRWPLVHIRKFKCEDRPKPAHDLLTLEASCHCECGGGTYQFTTNHGKELVLLVRDAMRKLSLKRREQEEKLQEMRSMRRLRLSMRTESDPCLQNKLQIRRQRSDDCDSVEKRSSHEDIPSGEVPYYLTLLPEDYCSSTPEDSSSDSDTECNRSSQSYSGSSSPDQRIRSRTVSSLTTSSVSSSDDLPPLPPPRPKHTFIASAKPLPPIPSS